MKVKLLTAIIAALLLTRFLPITQPVKAATCSNTAVGAFTCVQSYATNKAASATPAYAIPTNIASASNILVGVFNWASTTGTLTSITFTGCGGGATPVIYDNPNGLVAWRSAAFAVYGLSTGACTLTFNLSASFASAAAIHEIGGAVNNADPVGSRHNHNEQAAPGTGTDAVTSGAVTATGIDYVFSGTIDCNAGAQINAGSAPWNGRESTAAGGGGGCWITSEDQSASGANTATFTDTNVSAYNFTNVLSIAAAAGGTTSIRGHLIGVLPFLIFPHRF